MIKNGTIDYLCYIPFDFEEPTYKTFDQMVVDYGMGLVSEDIFEYAMDILLETVTLDDVLNELDFKIFPEHVPNDSVRSCLSLCINFIAYLIKLFRQYKRYLNILVMHRARITLNRHTATVELRFLL